jgi:hypothetical protein
MRYPGLRSGTRSDPGYQYAGRMALSIGADAVEDQAQRLSLGSVGYFGTGWFRPLDAGGAIAARWPYPKRRSHRGAMALP